MKNGIQNFLNLFVIVAVFACISCSHQRGVSDGGLAVDNFGSDLTVVETTDAEVVGTEQAGETVALEDATQTAAVTESAPTGGSLEDAAIVVAEEAAASEGGSLIATNENPVELMPDGANSDVIPSASEIAAAVSEQTNGDTTGSTDAGFAPVTKEKKKSNFKRKNRKTSSTNEAPQTKVDTTSQNETISTTPPAPDHVDAPAPSSSGLFKNDDEAEENAPQQAGAGIAGFIENHAFWVSAGIVGLILCLFFFARRKREDFTM